MGGLFKRLIRYKIVLSSPVGNGRGVRTKNNGIGVR